VASPKLTPLLRKLDALTDERAPIELLREELARLEITRADLGGACRFSEEKYRRNIIRRTDAYELVALCWRPGQRTPIHDHTGSTCGLLVVEGDATETRYEPDGRGVIRRIGRSVMHEGSVCASQDSDIHEVANLGERDLITLHCYSPPIARFHRYEEDSAEVVMEDLGGEVVEDPARA
jgi:cysteine dioxygenase